MAKDKKSRINENALERVYDLFKEARLVFKTDEELSKKYVKLARKIAMRVNLRMPREIKVQFCRNCDAYMIPGVNCRIRTKNRKVVYYCLECKHFRKYLINKKNNKKYEEK